MSEPSLNSSTKNALLSFTKGAIKLDPAVTISENDPNLVEMTREFREKTKLQNRIEPMLEKRHIPQTLKQMTNHLDQLENNRSTQAAHQSFTPRVLDLTARVSERTEQHSRLVNDTHHLIDKMTHFFRNITKQLWGDQANKALTSITQQPEALEIKKDTKDVQTRREDLAKNLPELAMRLRTLSKEIKSVAATVPTQGAVSPRQEQS